jgi:transcription elongation factor GreB
VSKAFTSEEVPDLPEVVVGRPELPPGVPNYVTARGLAELRAELDGLPAGRRRSELEARIQSAVVAPPPESLDVVRFGARVTIALGGDEQSFQIVGVDEADPARGKLAFISPLARALLGRREGDSLRWSAPGGVQELEILAVDYRRE